MTEAKQLYQDGIVTIEELQRIEQYEDTKPFSIHWELRLLLYIGILLLTSGIGILVYLNIDTIGHQTILAAIAVAIGACFYYLFRNRQLYSDGEVKNISPLFDYIALLGCLLSATFVGYLQFAYRLFGNQLWLATGLPAALFLYCAYRFDHKGLLALGITGIAGTAGLSITPRQLLNYNNFTDSGVLFTALALGVLLIVTARYSDQRGIKRHFSFSYHNFAATLLFVSCLAFLFYYPYKFISFLLLAGLCFYFIKYAIAQQSFLFLLYAAIYTYIGVTYLVFSVLLNNNYGEGAMMISMLYIILSCVGVIFFFVKYKTILRLR